MRPRPVRDHPSTPYVEFAAWLCCLSSLTVIFLDLRGAFSGNAFSSWTYGMAAFALGFAATHILAIFSQIISDSRSSKGILALLTFWIGLIAIFVLDWIIVRFFS